MEPRDFITPRQLAQAIGVSESSLKRWSDKGLIHVVKTVGGHRRIPFSVVIQFLRTTQTPLINPEIIGLKGPLDSTLLDSASAANALHASLISGDTSASIALVIRFYLRSQSVAAVCDRLLQPAMAAVGRDWECGKEDVFAEHRATQICLEIINELRRLIPPPGLDAPRIVGGAGPQDPHFLATAMVQLACTEQGWNALNLGPDVPFESLRMASAAINAHAMWLSIANAESAALFAAEADRFAHPSTAQSARLLVGGRGLEPGRFPESNRLLRGESMSDIAKLLLQVAEAR